jgi:type II secretory pathway component GspD/PulD (secretin)
MKVQFEKLVFVALVLLGVESVAAEQACDPTCSVKVVNSHPPQLLGDMAAQLGIQIVFEGDLLAPVSVEFEEKSVDQLVRKVADIGGYLVKRKGTRYTLYGANVAEVTIALTPRHIKAEEGAQHLGQFENVEILILEAANSLVLRGTSEDVRRAIDLLHTIDFDLPNVFLELLIVEYYHEDDFIWAYDIVSGEKGKVSNLLALPGAGTLSGNYEALADLPKSFRLNLTALVQDSEARVVTNPHVAVRSGEPGRIELKEELNIILSNETDNFGTTRTLETLEAGVVLDVTPVVLDDGFVDLQVEGEVSVFVPAAQGEFAIARQSVTTKLLLESGKTLVIGGMVLKESAATDSGVPGLRKIPILGHLFKSKSNAVRYIETVIYITPYVNDPSFFLPENIDGDVQDHFDTL